MVTMQQLIHQAQRELDDCTDEAKHRQNILLRMRDDLEAGSATYSHEQVGEAARARDKALREQKYAQDKLDRLLADEAEDQRISQMRKDITPTATADFFTRNRGQKASVYSVNARAVYTAEGAANGERSYLTDLFRAQVLGDPAAMRRLDEHGQTVPQDPQHRDASTANVAGFVPPQYLVELFAEAVKAGRPSANLCTPAPLPPSGMSVNLGRVTTATSIAAQNGENTAVSNTDPDDTLLTVPVRTYAGYADLSRQAVERGEMVDQLVMADLATSYNAALNSAILNGDGNNGTHTGIRNIAGIGATTYTDATPTIGELLPKIADAVGKVMSQRYTGPDAIVMHPRLWAWMLGQVDSDGRPLVVPNGAGPNNAAGVAGTPDYTARSAGYLFGVPVVLDGTVPTNLGAGTNETAIIVGAFKDAYLFEDPAGAPAQLRVEQPLADQLGIRFVAYGYSAFAGGRFPTAFATVTGTGLILT